MEGSWTRDAPQDTEESWSRGRRKAQKHRSVRDVVRVIGARPPGYITTDDAARLLSDVSDSSARIMVGQWILNREIEALIVADYKPPTKGLPGRLMVDKESLRRRLDQREINKRTRGALFREAA